MYCAFSLQVFLLISKMTPLRRLRTLFRLYDTHVGNVTSVQHFAGLQNRIISSSSKKRFAFLSRTFSNLSSKDGNLDGAVDRFGGVTVDLGQLSSSLKAEDFQDILSTSLQSWQDSGKRGIWLKVPIMSSHFIPVAATEGFTFHHADPNHSILTKWLDTSSPNKLPKPASHQVGCAGFVFREDTKEVLVVKEKNRRMVMWKFPGGVSDLGENIGDTAEREVFEETGVKAEFQSVLGFRQQHLQPGAFGRSDFYFVCRLRPLTFDLIPCRDEISACRWMPIAELDSDREISGITRRITRLVMLGMERGFDNVEMERDKLQSIHKGLDYQIYHRHIPCEKR
ncbi:nucleoside diphosphate-linked moiety X motif 6-like [Lineus longissimus]|uniref:nucleoside diphosphate-linked moiety X motif 6-like n=1 Tax=Lineus longissimus TaxID=88925 RepID=UPI00315DC02B